MIRPQPIGIFPFRANFLLLPENALDAAAYDALMRGELPAGAPVYRFAAEGDLTRARRSLSNDDSDETKFNRFALDPSAEQYAALKREFSGPLAALLDAFAFTLNYADAPPATDGLDGEILAAVLLARATAALEREDAAAATGHLQEAIAAAEPVSPVFAAQLAGTLAETLHQYFGASAEVVTLYRQTLDALENTALDAARATFNLNCGICFQEMARGARGALLEAVRHYQDALKYFTREAFPEEFAFTQNNLALAYLSIPLTEASDTLRVAIAIQALREALKVYTRETHPELWASTQLNLANALQYAPSAHVEENLMEAVNLYEEILNVRRENENPLGYARLLANQGNALAHLGVFAHAVPKLQRAETIFRRLDDADSADSIAEVLRDIAGKDGGQRSAVGGQ